MITGVLLRRMSVALTIAASSTLISVRPSAAETVAEGYLRDSGTCWVWEKLNEGTGTWSEYFGPDGKTIWRGGNGNNEKWGGVPSFFKDGYINNTHSGLSIVLPSKLTGAGVAWRVRQVPCPPPQTAFNGLYLGGNIAGNFINLSQQERSKKTDDITGDFRDSSQAVGVGFNGGFLFSPWNNNVVIGPSASVDFFNQDTFHRFPPGPSFLGQTINSIATLNGQIGVYATPGLFLFGELGAAFVNLDQKLNFSGPVTSVQKDVTGLNLGLGAAYQPPGWEIGGNPVSLVGQYNHIILPGTTFDNPGSTGFLYRNENQINEFKIGARIQFGDYFKASAPRESGSAGTLVRMSKSGLTKSRRAAKDGKDNDRPVNAKQPKKDEAKKEDPPPTPWSKDPKDGIDVPDMPGVKVHRGTGTVSGYKGGPRNGIYCWVHLADKDKCKKTAQYQFATVNIEAKWGNDAQANINDLVKKVRAQDGGFLPVTANGVYTKPGQMVGDDYKGTKNKDPLKIKDPAGKDVSAGQYPPAKIPGADGDEGLIDAPYTAVSVAGFANDLVPASLKEPSKPSPTPPPESDVGTITVLHHFSTYVYCMDPKKCLGFFEWDYNETITIRRKWKEFEKKGDVADEALSGLGESVGGSKKKGKGEPAEAPKDKKWIPYFVVNGAPKVDGPTIGEWQPCP